MHVKAVSSRLPCFDRGAGKCFGAILYGMTGNGVEPKHTRYMPTCPWKEQVEAYLKNKAAA